MRVCSHCGEPVNPKRAALGYRTCLPCGEQDARAERAGWCVVQEYGKGAYQYVTPSSARRTLRETNQKQPR
jgi:hypothetical protein